MQVGDKIEIVADHDGPASYVNGTGETIYASDFGIGGFELVQIDALSNDGLNYAYTTITGQSTAGNVGNAVPSVTLRWFVVATGLEVANGIALNTKSIRLQIRGV
jgi:hypothetical protein